jgi:hypothetical protein
MKSFYRNSFHVEIDQFLPTLMEMLFRAVNGVVHLYLTGTLVKKSAISGRGVSSKSEI